MRSVVGTSLRVSSAAGFGTAYILVESGLTTSWVGPLANTILVPWTALFVLPASLIGALMIAISTFSSDIFSLLLTLVCGAHPGGKSGRKGGPPCWRRRVREEEYHGGAALPGRPACSRETGRREPHTALTQSSAGTLDS